MNRSGICIVIPTYNNAGTLCGVIDSVLEHGVPVVVVNDGSTDGTGAILGGYGERIGVVSYQKNRGKGHALARGFDRAEQMGYSHALTLDSDGQHFADDIPLFLQVFEKNPGALVIGSRNLAQDNMPQKNTFANKFSNFWFTLQTAKKLPDTQTGYRLYPLHRMKGLRPTTSRYEAELEMLVRCAWRRTPIIPIPIGVYYAPEGERVSHFRPGKDFFRISVLNTVFVAMALVYGYPSMGIRYLFGKR